MRNRTAEFGTLYQPVRALVIYEKQADGRTVYVESYDMDERGFPINAHPLSQRECAQLANALDNSGGLERSFLKPEGLMPKNILYINPGNDGYAIWHTPQRDMPMLFTEGLGIPNGTANVPAMVWKASKEKLSVFAVATRKGIKATSRLCHAPFFNVYPDGMVCMGSVSINMPPSCQLEAFMRQWEGYFFNSYFSHLFAGHSPVKGNIVQLWQGLVNSNNQFPVKGLIKNGLTLKDIL
jgi:PRTRC genetic system protein B